MLGMSHLPIREAIRRLEGVGLVTHVPHRGATVTELSLEDLRELYEARLLVEPALIARAATNFHGEDEEAARLALIRQREAERRGSTAEAWAAHTDFHFALYRPSRATWLLHLALPLWNSSQRYRLAITTLREAARRREAHAEHERMLTACAARDGQAAARVLHDHLVGTANVIAEQMGGGHLFERTSHPRRRGAR